MGLRTSVCFAAAGRGAGAGAEDSGAGSSAVIDCDEDWAGAGAPCLAEDTGAGFALAPAGLADPSGGNGFAEPPAGLEDDNGGNGFLGVALSESFFVTSCSSAIDLPLRNNDDGTSLERDTNTKYYAMKESVRKYPKKDGMRI